MILYALSPFWLEAYFGADETITIHYATCDAACRADTNASRVLILLF